MNSSIIRLLPIEFALDVLKNDSFSYKQSAERISQLLKTRPFSPEERLVKYGANTEKKTPQIYEM